MAIVDHFERVEETGYACTIDPEAARRQFNMSLGLLVVLAIAAAAITLSLRSGPQVLAAQLRAPVRLVVEMPQRVQVQQAAEQASQLPGG
jgi:hypothetical protein